MAESLILSFLKTIISLFFTLLFKLRLGVVVFYVFLMNVVFPEFAREQEPLSIVIFVLLLLGVAASWVYTFIRWWRAQKVTAAPAPPQSAPVSNHVSIVHDVRGDVSVQNGSGAQTVNKNKTVRPD